jgi:hypothetical protein
MPHAAATLVVISVHLLQITLTHGLRSAKAAPAIATSYLSVVWGILGSLFIFHEVCNAAHRHFAALCMVYTSEYTLDCVTPAADPQKPSGESILGAVLIIITTGVLGFAEKKKPKPSAAQNGGETVEQPLMSAADRPES